LTKKINLWLKKQVISTVYTNKKYERRITICSSTDTEFKKDINKNSMKNKTLLEAATDMLLNRPESVVAEAVPSINMEKLSAKDIFAVIKKAIDALHERVGGEPEDEDDEDQQRVLEELMSFTYAFNDLVNEFKKARLYEASDEDTEELEEATEVDNIAAKVAELKVGDKTNFGVVIAKSSNSVTFKAKDLPKTTITFNKRKMGSRDYVLSALRMIK